MSRFVVPFISSLVGLVGLVAGLGLVLAGWMYQERVETGLGDAATALEQVEQGVKAASDELGETVGIFPDVRTAVAAVRATVELSGSSLTSLATALDDLSGGVAAVATELRSLSRTLTSLGRSNDLDGAAVQLTTAATELSAVPPQLRALTEQLAIVSDSIQRLDGRLEVVERQLDPVRRYADATSARVASVRDAVASQQAPQLMIGLTYVGGGLLAFFGLAFLVLAHTQRSLARALRESRQDS